VRCERREPDFGTGRLVPAVFCVVEVLLKVSALLSFCEKTLRELKQLIEVLTDDADIFAGAVG
jgi:hypothetical protein